MNKIIKTILVSLGIMGTLAGTTLLLFSNKQKVDAKVYQKNPDILPIVEVQKASSRTLSEDLTLLGTFSPNREIDVLSEANGKVEYVGVAKGQFIGEGHTIATLNADILQAQLTSAKASYNKAVLDVNRLKAVTEVDALPKSQLDQVELGKIQAETQINLLNKQISQTIIKSPFSGTVLMRMFEKGSVLSPGVPTIKLMDISTLKLMVNVPETDVFSLKIGQQFTVTTDAYPNKTFNGIVTVISNKGDAAHNYEVEISVPNSQTQLKAGMYGNVLLKRNSSNTSITIPRSAILGSYKNEKVYVVKDNIAYLKNITISKTSGDFVQVTEGISEGEMVVIAGQINLTDNTKVSIKETKNLTLKIQ